jgi:hypothetical protein
LVGTAVASLALAACSSSSTSAGSSTTTSPGSSACGPVTQTAVEQALAVSVHRPTVEVHGDRVLCSFASTAGVHTPSVTVHIDRDTTPAQFVAARQAFSQVGESTVAVNGIGSDGFSSTIDSAGVQVNTVVVRTGSTQLWITAGAPLEKVEGLARQVIGQL